VRLQFPGDLISGNRVDNKKPPRGRLVFQRPAFAA